MIVNTKIKNIAVLLVVMAAIAGFLWFAFNFGIGGEKVQSEQPLVICNPPDAPLEQQTCYWTAHMHFTLTVVKGTQGVPIGFERGDLQAMHTHAEKDIIHWHGLISADPKTKEITDWSVLHVGNIPRDLRIPFTGRATFMVNGKEVDPSYIWQDGDTIEIRYE